MKMRYLLSCMSLSLLVLFSCASMKKQSKTEKDSPLAGTAWTIGKIDGFELEQTRKPVTLIFEDSLSRFGGNAGCNRYGGSYAATGTELKLEKIIATKMACMPGMKTESKLMEVLHSTDHYRVTGDQLILMQGDKVLAEFSRSKKEQK